LELAQVWLNDTWSFLQNVQAAYNMLIELKQKLQESNTRFRGVDCNLKDGEAHNANVTDELQAYVDQIRKNVELILSP
jgi:hypothetical protein